MKKIIWTTSIAGLGLTAGGLGMLSINGFAVMNPELWSLALELAKRDPGSLIEGASSGSDKVLFRGIVFVISGVGVSTLGLVTTSTFALLAGFSTKVKHAKSSMKIKAQKATGGGITDRPRQGWSIGKFDIKKKFGSVFEKDEEIDFEKLDATTGSGSSRGSVKDNSSDNRLKIKRSMKDELSDVMRGYKATVLSVFGRDQRNAKDETDAYDLETASSKRESFGDLTDWIRDLRSGNFDHSEYLSRARAIRSEWDDADFDEFASLDPIEGAYMVRLLKSWADRPDVEMEDLEVDMGPGSDDDPREHSREVMREALRAINRGDVVTDPSEKIMDLDDEFDEVGLDVEIDNDDYDSMMAEAIGKVTGVEKGEEVVGEEQVDEEFSSVMSQVNLDGGDEIETTDAEDEDVSLNIEEQVEISPDNEVGEKSSSADDEAGPIGNVLAVISEMRGFVALYQSVVGGEEEWPEDLADEDLRNEVASSLSTELGVLVDIHLNEDLKNLVEQNKEKFDEFAWLSDHPKILDLGFVKFVETFLNADYDSDVGDDEIGFLDADEVSETDDNPVEHDAEFEQVEVAQSELSGEAGIDDENGSLAGELQDDEEAIQSDGFVSVAGDVDGQEVDAGHHEDEEAVASSDDDDLESPTEQIDELTDETTGESVEEHLEVEAIEPREPRYVGIPDSEEIDEAGSIPLNWGRNCKNAGATGATVGKLIFGRSDTSFKTVGFAHVVMVWKVAAGDIRLNVILKKVPTGTWSLNLGDDIRIENEEGDYVNVSAELLNHPEIKDSKTIIHFYGDDFAGFETVSVGDNTLVVSEMFSSDQISKFVKN